MLDLDFSPCDKLSKQMIKNKGPITDDCSTLTLSYMEDKQLNKMLNLFLSFCERLSCQTVPNALDKFIKTLRA